VRDLKLGMSSNSGGRSPNSCLRSSGGTGVFVRMDRKLEWLDTVDLLNASPSEVGSKTIGGATGRVLSKKARVSTCGKGKRGIGE